MQDRLRYLYVCLGFLLTKADSYTIGHQDSKATPIYFRWSGGFELNWAESRCATDQSTGDPDNVFAEAYPEMKGL